MDGWMRARERPYMRAQPKRQDRLSGSDREEIRSYSEFVSLFAISEAVFTVLQQRDSLFLPSLLAISEAVFTVSRQRRLTSRGTEEGGLGPEEKLVEKS